MLPLFFDKPYQFLSPSRRRIWPWIFRQMLPSHLRKHYGLQRMEYRGVEHLHKSLEAKHAIMLSGNHCRPCDPMVVGGVYGEIPTPCYFVAAWHIFEMSRFQKWLLRSTGAFSLNREMVDRTSLNFSINVLQNAERPLVIFPEGAITRANDHIFPLLEGVSFIARTAARRRAKAIPGGKVMVHPVVVKYTFHGDLEQTLNPVLDRLERRFYWNSQAHLPITQRIHKFNDLRLAAKEIEHFSQPQGGSYHQRTMQIINHLLEPLEDQWISGSIEENIFTRCKNLRAAILPDMVKNKVDEEERARRWRLLADIYDCHCLSSYPEGYLDSDEVSPERLIEMVEKFEEDLTDQSTIHGPLSVVVQFDEGIEVDPTRDRNAKVDPLLQQISQRLQAMIDELNDSVKRNHPLKMHNSQFDRSPLR